jgi:hypothetical protein
LVVKFFENSLKWWKAHEAQIPLVGNLACQILGFVGNQIKVGQFILLLKF